jgi:alkaline phosphatase
MENPLLRDATLAALKVLSQHKEGFFLMVEQGDIDSANHAKDYRRMIGTIWDLDLAVETAVNFVNQEGDDIDWANTLLIVTSDHGNSFMRLNIAKPLGAGDLPAQADSTYPDGEVAYGTGKHTNELVRVYAKGMAVNVFFGHEGEWYPGQRIIDNTQLYHIMAEAAGVPQDSPLKVMATKAEVDKKP